MIRRISRRHLFVRTSSRSNPMPRGGSRRRAGRSERGRGTMKFSPIACILLANVFAGALVGTRPVLHAQGKNDPFVGTWKLDVEKSVFEPGPPPISRTMTFVPVDNGVT